MVRPHLDHVARVLPVRGTPSDVARVVRAARSHHVVHLNPSFRRRAIVRDGTLHRLLRSLGVRTLVHWHGVDRRLLAELDRYPRRRAALRQLLGDADRTFVLVPELRGALVRWGWGPTEMVCNPAPSPHPEDRDPEPRRVLFVGRLEEDKGVHALAVAIRILRRRDPDARLVLAGSGSQTVRGPGVTTLGWVDEAQRRRELSRASVLVLPTRDDAAPMAVLEALAAGVPVVATHVGAIPEMVGSHGVLVDRPDPASLVSAIRTVWSRRFARPDLSAHRPQAIAAQWASTYAEIACAGG